tara:strand:- start:654 stop:1421 length:768 start_codon:yes stop_codon:yes gene_type:complete
MVDNINKVNERLNNFIKNKSVPNILFHGKNNDVKDNIIKQFLHNLYDTDTFKQYVMIVNCAHGRGIKFVREDIKFFAKTNISLENGLFKSIVLLNAEKLTVDAQSALRRCIEIFSHSTRFILVVDDKEKLLKPILSRLCDIFIDTNSSNNNFFKYNSLYASTNKYIKNELSKFSKKKKDLFILSEKLYNKGVTALHLTEFINNKQQRFIANNKSTLLFHIMRIKKSIKDEKILILIILDLYFFRCETNLENIDFL